MRREGRGRVVEDAILVGGDGGEPSVSEGRRGAPQEIVPSAARTRTVRTVRGTFARGLE